MTQNPSPVAKQSVSNSLFYLWRCIIAVVLADGVYHPTERKFLDKAFTAFENAYAVTDEHRKTFSEDLKAPKNIDDLLPHVTEPLHRSLLPYFGQFITLIDGKQHSRETAFLKDIQEKINDPVVREISAELQLAIAARRTSGKIHHFNLIDFLLDRLGIGPLE